MTTGRRRSSRAQVSAVARNERAAAAKHAKPGKRAAPMKSGKNHTRPGVAAAVRLVSLRPLADHAGKWERAASCYSAMIKAKGGAKLAKLDKQREDMARGWAASKSATFMSKEQLLDVVIEWKFTKGKPRHALKPLLKSNSETAIAAAAKRAFRAADSIPKDDAGGEYDEEISSALNHLCKLTGVGPATASAVLCMYRPDAFAFMDDEVIECLYDGKRGYTLKIYKEVNGRCREIAAELNEAGKGLKWTPCRVGKALWAMATMSATGDEDGLSAVFEEGSADSCKRVQKG